MRYIGLHKDLKLREIQIDYFVDLLSECKNKKEIKEFVESVISPSELAYISQRLHIIRLIVEEKSYSEIRDDTGTTSGTINATKILIKSIDKKILSFISKFKLKEKPVNSSQHSTSNNDFAKAHYPGAIKID